MPGQFFFNFSVTNDATPTIFGRVCCYLFECLYAKSMWFTVLSSMVLHYRMLGSGPQNARSDFRK